MVNGQTTIYDKAMDAVYNATRVGGGDHRLYDGGHTLWGAVSAVRNASPDDSIFEEARGLVLGLLRDVSTPNGPPVVNWDIETLSALNDRLTDIAPIPKEWLKDMVSYDITDVFGAGIAGLAVILKWNSEDTEEFTQLAVGAGLASIYYANPFLALVSLVALGRAFHKAKQSGDYIEFFDGGFRGVATTGVTIATLAFVSGPFGTPILAALVMGLIVHKLTAKLSVSDITRVVGRQIRMLARDTTKIQTRHPRWRRGGKTFTAVSRLTNSSRLQLLAQYKRRSRSRRERIRWGVSSFRQRYSTTG